MLSKLIKYDMKALNRFLIVMHGFLLLSAILGRFLLTGRISFSKPDETTQLLLALSFILYVLIITGVSFGTQLVIVVRFYKNLFSDEGYLSHTLPVSTGQHLLSKTITGTIWCVADILLLFLSMWIVAATPSVVNAFNTHKTEVLEVLGFTGSFSASSLIAAIALLLFIGGLSGIIMLYASVAMGQLFPNHRILGAVVSYFILSTVISIFTLLAMTVTGFFTQYIPVGYRESISTSFNFSEYMLYLTKFTIVISVIISAILYIFTYYVIKKKTNLQ